MERVVVGRACLAEGGILHLHPRPPGAARRLQIGVRMCVHCQQEALAGVQQHIVIPIAVVDGVHVPDEQARVIPEVLRMARGHVHHVVRFAQADVEASLIVAPLYQVVMCRLVS